MSASLSKLRPYDVLPEGCIGHGARQPLQGTLYILNPVRRVVNECRLAVRTRRRPVGYVS